MEKFSDDAAEDGETTGTKELGASAEPTFPINREFGQISKVGGAVKYV